MGKGAGEWVPSEQGAAAGQEQAGANDVKGVAITMVLIDVFGFSLTWSSAYACNAHAPIWTESSSAAVIGCGAWEPIFKVNR